jgi:hypothetical protein
MYESEIDNELYEIDLTNRSGVGLYYLQLIDSGSQIIDTRKIILE